jgi:hypothetical protein
MWYQSMSRLLKCRCGTKIREGRYDCPKASREGELFVYHDLVAQSFSSTMLNWIVIRRKGKFIPCAGGREGPEHFETERAAWEHLDALYWSHIDWPEDEGTIYAYESVRLQKREIRETSKAKRPKTASRRKPAEADTTASRPAPSAAPEM